MAGRTRSMEPPLTQGRPSCDGAVRRDKPKRVSALKKGLNADLEGTARSECETRWDGIGPQLSPTQYAPRRAVWTTVRSDLGSPGSTWSKREERGRESAKFKRARCVGAAPHDDSCGLAGHMERSPKASSWIESHQTHATLNSPSPRCLCSRAQAQERYRATCSLGSSGSLALKANLDTTIARCGVIHRTDHLAYVGLHGW